MDGFIFVAIGVSVYLLSALIHEIGHLIAAKRIDPHAKISFKFPKLKTEMNILDYDFKIYGESIIISGILIGIVPILLSAIIIDLTFILLLIPYMFGIEGDIIKLAQINNIVVPNKVKTTIVVSTLIVIGILIFTIGGYTGGIVVCNQFDGELMDNLECYIKQNTTTEYMGLYIDNSIILQGDE